VASTKAGVSAEVTIPVQGPFNWEALRAWLSARAIEQLEDAEAAAYRRSGMIGATPVVVDVEHRTGIAALRLRVSARQPFDVAAIVARVQRVFDIDRDLLTMQSHLRLDPWMAGLLVRHAGLRVPGGWDPFELAVRAVLGQQVTIGAARQLASQLVALCGTSLPPSLQSAGVTRLFPTAAQLAAADLGALRMPGARRATLGALARAAAEDDGLFQASASLDDAVSRLRAVKGIGEWTAHYIALRALRHPDAFPASDIGLLRGAARETGTRPGIEELRRRAEVWRPYRAYAAQVLWAEDGEK
jgi:3-methyladenine DNA glycosylase/8-oxoguanine DNA glycosylase